MYVREMTVRYRLRRIRGGIACRGRLERPRDAAALLGPILGDEIVEVVGVLCLSTCREVLAYHELSRGTIDASVVQPRDLFRTALLAHAASVLVAHNHPSGDVTPSPHDAALTDRLIAAGDLLGVELVDHLIVTTGGQYYSFKEAGQIPVPHTQPHPPTKA